jgi:hypothetical protein
MVDKQLQKRRKLYFELSSNIVLIDNARLRVLLADSDTSSAWGRNHTIEVGRSKVFVKRVPVTDIEYDNMFSTRNLYDLPTYYNYGFGSAGLGVFRELVAQIKTTNWVLEGAIATFPLMYHYRIIPFEGEHAEVDKERHARYVEYWGSNANVGRYMLDRARARYEMVLFLEHIPHTVASWLPANPAKMPLVTADMHATVTFLRKNGILHLDAHFNNMLTDGKRVYLTDFGLALDKEFELTPAEKEFYRQHSYFDFGYLLWNLGSFLSDIYHGLPDDDKNRISEICGISAGAEYEELLPILLNHSDQIIASGIMKLDRDYATSLAKYRSVATLMFDFYVKMRRNNAKDTRFDHAKLLRLLKETGFVPGPVSIG